MKKLNCDLCDHVEAGDTFDEWMTALKPHYMQVHADVMASKKGSPEEMKSEMMKWMSDNQRRFDEAEEL